VTGPAKKWRTRCAAEAAAAWWVWGGAGGSPRSRRGLGWGRVGWGSSWQWRCGWRWLSTLPPPLPSPPLPLPPPPPPLPPLPPGSVVVGVKEEEGDSAGEGSGREEGKGEVGSAAAAAGSAVVGEVVGSEAGYSARAGDAGGSIAVRRESVSAAASNERATGHGPQERRGGGATMVVVLALPRFPCHTGCRRAACTRSWYRDSQLGRT